MATIFDYLDWRGDVPFETDGFNDVDNLVLAELAYTHFDGIVPEDGTQITLRKAAEAFFNTHPSDELAKETNVPSRAPFLMDGMLSGKRFSGMTLSNYINIVDEDNTAQISALTYRLSDGTAYVAFRGTDSTIIGWKEDFNMSYLSETEGQKKAIEYLNRVGSRLRRPIRVGGHSKGGNFAIYASAFCKPNVRGKIINVYSNDGPGFRNEVMATEEYKKIVPKVVSIVPDTSIIGMLLTSTSKYHVVASSANGIMQHDGMTWQVRRNDFEHAELSELGTFIRDTQKDWLSRIDDETRESFVNSIFSLFEATGMGTFGKMSDNKLKSVESMLSAVQALPKDKQVEMIRIFRELFHIGGHRIRDSISDSLNELIGDDK